MLWAKFSSYFPLIANSEDVVAVYDPTSLVMGINIQSFGVPFRENDNCEKGKSCSKPSNNNVDDRFDIR